MTEPDGGDDYDEGEENDCSFYNEENENNVYWGYWMSNLTSSENERND